MDGVLSTHRRAIRWLARLHGRGATLASVCTGAFLLAETGLLDGRAATTHWGFADEFRRRYPRVRLMPERTITDEGDLLCAGGADSGLWLCLHLIEKELGHEVAAQTAKAFLLDLRPSPQRLLERARDGIEQVGYEVGYGDSRFFRRLFRKQVGTGPASYRKRFGRRPAASRLRRS